MGNQGRKTNYVKEIQQSGNEKKYKTMKAEYGEPVYN